MDIWMGVHLATITLIFVSFLMINIFLLNTIYSQSAGGNQFYGKILRSSTNREDHRYSASQWHKFCHASCFKYIWYSLAWVRVKLTNLLLIGTGCICTDVTTLPYHLISGGLAHGDTGKFPDGPQSDGPSLWFLWLRFGIKWVLLTGPFYKFSR